MRTVRHITIVALALSGSLLATSDADCCSAASTARAVCPETIAMSAGRSGARNDDSAIVRATTVVRIDRTDGHGELELTNLGATPADYRVTVTQDSALALPEPTGSLAPHESRTIVIHAAATASNRSGSSSTVHVDFVSLGDGHRSARLDIPVVTT